jgi:hypothetical protein
MNFTVDMKGDVAYLRLIGKRRTKSCLQKLVFFRRPTTHTLMPDGRKLLTFGKPATVPDVIFDFDVNRRLIGIEFLSLKYLRGETIATLLKLSEEAPNTEPTRPSKARRETK